MRTQGRRRALVVDSQSIALRAGTILVLLWGLAASVCPAQPRTVLLVSVAASMTDAMQEIEASYRHDHPQLEIRNNFGSSGTLAREIEQGAPVDVFLSAASKPMDDLEAQGLIAAGSRRNLLRNTLVLITSRDVHLSGFAGLTDRSVRVIAVGDPASVPAGQYAQQTLAYLHLLEGVRSKFVLAKDVRQVLAYVATGNADAGLVYATDAATSARVRVVATAPEQAHDPIVYPAAAIAHGRNESAARAFVDYLGSPAARAIFQKHGFTVTAQ